MNKEKMQLDYFDRQVALERFYDHELNFMVEEVIPEDNGSHGWIKDIYRLKVAYDILSFIVCDDGDFPSSVPLYYQLDVQTAFEAVAHSNVAVSIWNSSTYQDQWKTLLDDFLSDLFTAKLKLKKVNQNEQTYSHN